MKAKAFKAPEEFNSSGLEKEKFLVRGRWFRVSRKTGRSFPVSYRDVPSDVMSEASSQLKKDFQETNGLLNYASEKYDSTVFKHAKKAYASGLRSSAFAITVYYIPGETDKENMEIVSTISDYFNGQLSDGWGEGFEQQYWKSSSNGSEYHYSPWTRDAGGIQ